MRYPGKDLWIAAVLLLVAMQAVADIGPPVSMRLLGEPRPALPGEIYRGIIEITLDNSGELTNFRLEGANWNSWSVQGPSSIRLNKRQKLDVPFSAMPDNPVKPLEFVFEYNGHRVSKYLDLSEEHFLRMTQGVPAVPIQRTDLPVRPANSLYQVPEPTLDPSLPPPRKSESRLAYNIRVHGRFAYDNEFGASAPVDGMNIYVIHTPHGGGLDVLALIATDADGFYDATFSWDPLQHDFSLPNLSLWFFSANAWAEVRDSTYDYAYRWTSQTYWNFEGTDLGFPWLAAADGTRPAAFIMTTLTRAHRWLLNYPNPNYAIPSVGVVWPAGEGIRAFYRISEQRIYLYHSDDPNQRHNQWNEGVQCHEFGHHWANIYTGILDFDYCNGFCDDPPPCSHCNWCPEDEVIAWMEGWPNWFSPVITTTFFDDYGVWYFNPKDFESLQACDGFYYEPAETEGFVSALLWDISDDNQDSHPLYAFYTDDLAMGVDEIFLAVDIHDIHTVWEFINWFELEHPIYRQSFWETAKNCGFDIDDYPPGAVTNLNSTSHVINVPSTDSTVDMTWQPALDDASGIAGYGIQVGSWAGMPPHIRDIGNVTSHTVGPLNPGQSYYYNIVAQDRDGRWSNDYASFGPIVITAPEPADLEFHSQFGWVEVLVPRPSADAGPFVPMPGSLPGNSNSTYWNLCGINSGEAVTSLGFWAHLLVDGYQSGLTLWGPVNGGTSFQALNQGPISVRGGRHTLEARLDATEVIAESDETNNRWAQQWVWSPQWLTPGTPVIRAAPPPRQGGWESVVDGSTLYNNCDGLRYLSYTGWNAVWVHALNNGLDYDCQLFTESSGPTNGFAIPLAYSWSPPGSLDAVMINHHTHGTEVWDIGVINSYEPAIEGDYKASLVASGSLAIGDSLTVTFTDGEMLKLWEFNVPTGGPWPLSITAKTYVSDPVWALYLDDAYTHGPLYVNDGWTTTLNSGFGRIDIPSAESGYHCLVVYRNPWQHTEPCNVTIEIDFTPPDFHPLFATGWWRPLVPRPTEDGTPTQVDQPDTLHGYAFATYFNLAIRNGSAADAPFLHGHVYLDGDFRWPLTWGLFPGNGIFLINGDEPYIVPGGRHTLAMRLDDADEIEEIDEEDNNFGDQYCWSPYELTLGVPVVRDSPLEPTGNWEDVTVLDHPLWYNCDGLRMSEGIGWFKAVAVMANEPSDVDVRLHETLVGAKNGFGGYHAYSGWGPGESDFVMVNFHDTESRRFDAGVLHLNNEPEDYTAEAAGAVSIFFDGDNTYGPYTLGPGHILKLHQIYVTETGPVNFALANIAGSVDWGFSLYEGSEPYLTKSDMMVGGGSWFGGPGAGESFTVPQLVPLTPYCLAVWKRDRASLSLDGSYQLHIWSGTTPVPEEEPPVRTALSAVYPNPFNPQANIVFELAAPARVKLEIYDLQGRQIRTLVDAELPAARHEEIWDGRNDSGKAQASGIYFVRLLAGDYEGMQKVTLLK